MSVKLYDGVGGGVTVSVSVSDNDTDCDRSPENDSDSESVSSCVLEALSEVSCVSVVESVKVNV